MHSWFWPGIPVCISSALILAVSAVCSGCYTLKQGTAMLGYLNRAIPLEDLTEKGGEEDRRFAEQVEAIRRFAMEELGLKESKNYTRYVELDRGYLAAVVSASAKDSFTRYEWWFPVVGKVPYKGFFNPNDARKEQAKLEKKDLDVWIRGVSAFSTLGWFRDPLYSYMKEYSTGELADLIIHELLHATVYLKNHSQFNEELAEFVGSEGSRLYMEKISSSGTAPAASGAAGAEQEAADAKADGSAYIAFIQELIAELDGVYTSGISREEKLKQKAEIIAAAQKRFAENYDTLFKTEWYRGFSTLKVNNAYLELYRLYYEENDWFKDLYARSGADLPAFIATAKTLTGKSADPRVELEEKLMNKR
ncbi:MAG: aminopeptidase [Treponema sp.]|jgi:predicted aminopeptidase|nr:aminopeptidase [Treponema sp.]